MYRPTKRDTKRINELTKAYNYTERGLKLFAKYIKENSAADFFLYRMNKAHKKLLQIIISDLKEELINTEFYNIIKDLKI